MKLHKIQDNLKQREAPTPRQAIFKPTKAQHRVRFVPVAKDQAFYELSSVKLGDSYYTLPFRKTKMNGNKDENNYYTGLIQPVYAYDSNLYTEIKQKDKYIFYVIEVDEDGKAIRNSETGDILQTFYPSPGLGHTIIDGLQKLESGKEPFDNPGIAFRIVKGMNSRTKFNDYSNSYFEDEIFALENWDEFVKEAAEKKMPAKIAERNDVELALRNRLGSSITLAYKTLGQTSASASSGNENEELDEFEKELERDITF
jgi:hypothetical protein